jgi:hypothetical protein
VDTDDEKIKATDTDDKDTLPAGIVEPEFLYMGGIKVKNPNYVPETETERLNREWDEEQARLKKKKDDTAAYWAKKQADDDREAAIQAGYAGETGYAVGGEEVDDGPSNWYVAKRQAKQWGDIMGTFNPDDYYYVDDGSRPDGWEYVPDVVDDTDTVVDDTDTVVDDTDTVVDETFTPPDGEPEVEHYIPHIQETIEPSNQPKNVVLTPEEEYFKEQHFSEWNFGYTTKQMDYIPKTESGESALFGDTLLHEQLGMPEFISVVADSVGKIHQEFHPELVPAPFLEHAGHEITA